MEIKSMREVLLQEHDIEIKQLQERVKILEETVRNLHQECQRLYQTGFTNGVEVARKEYADEFKKLEDLGFISCHGFLKPESKELFDKWLEVNVDKFERSNLLTREENYNQMRLKEIDKALKGETLSDLYPTMHCATGTCSGCDNLYFEDGKGCTGDLFKYTCKKKDISVLSNTTPKPENFWKAIMNSEE